MDTQILTRESISSIDSLNLFKVISTFPEQVSKAIQFGQTAPVLNLQKHPKTIVVLGMGGSAIGGDLLKSLISTFPENNDLTVLVNRHYDLLYPINRDTVVIASSYSGNTEETLRAFEEATDFTDHIVCITSGGKLAEEARAHRLPLILIPSGFMPRAALGYSFFPTLLMLIRNSFFCKETVRSIGTSLHNLQETLKQLSAKYANFEDPNNYALQLARTLKDKAVVIYSSCGLMESVNLRWRCQIQENAKQLAFGNLLPEMNHNEVNSFTYPENLSKNFAVLFLRDLSDNPNISTRIKALTEILRAETGDIISIESSKSETVLERMFESIYLADWVSFYLAILNGIDPTPIPKITMLKDILASK